MGASIGFLLSISIENPTAITRFQLNSSAPTLLSTKVNDLSSRFAKMSYPGTELTGNHDDYLLFYSPTTQYLTGGTNNAEAPSWRVYQYRWDGSVFAGYYAMTSGEIGYEVCVPPPVNQVATS